MDISQNKDNVEIKHTNLKVNDIFLHKPTGLSVRVDVITRDIVTCSVFIKQEKIATYCTNINTAFLGNDWWYYGNEAIELKLKKHPEYWTKMKGR